MLESAGLRVDALQSSEAFCRFSVRDEDEATVVDLVADPVPLAEAPVETEVDGARILVDTPHQIFVNKLCALLSRSELRDLEDVELPIATLARALDRTPESTASVESFRDHLVERVLALSVPR